MVFNKERNTNSHCFLLFLWGFCTGLFCACDIIKNVICFQYNNIMFLHFLCDTRVHECKTNTGINLFYCVVMYILIQVYNFSAVSAVYYLEQTFCSICEFKVCVCIYLCIYVSVNKTFHTCSRARHLYILTINISLNKFKHFQ